MNGVDAPTDVKQVRARIRKMNDEQLLKYGQAAKYMCSRANMGKPPREAFLLQLHEAREELEARKEEAKIGSEAG